MEMLKADSLEEHPLTTETICRRLGDSRKEHILTTSVICFNKNKHNNAEIYTNVTVLEEALSGKKKVGEMTIVLPEQIKNDYKKRIFDAVNM